MMILTGTYLGFTENDRRYNDKQTGEAKSFTSRQFHVLDGFESRGVELGMNFADSFPTQGDHVSLEVTARASGSRVYFTVLRVLEAKAPAKSA